jgi:hypothetical protein
VADARVVPPDDFHDNSAPAVEIRLQVPAGYEHHVVLVPAIADGELTAMEILTAALDQLDHRQRRRVVDWAWARWHADYPDAEPPQAPTT